MCQLTLVYTDTKKLTGMLVYSLLTINSKLNGDGTGILNERGKFFKSKESADKLPITEAIFKLNSSFLMGHVRLASFPKIITDEKAHPFVGERFILMHNGTLTKITETKEETEKNKVLIDSEIFLNELEIEGKKTEDFVLCINNTMKKFHGKFAFLIQDTKYNKIYVVRGKSANLYTTNLIQREITGEMPVKGIVINTSDEPLKGNLLFSLEMFNYLFGKNYESTSPKILKAETIYELVNFTLNEVGEIKETEAPVSKKNWGYNEYDEYGYPIGRSNYQRNNVNNYSSGTIDVSNIKPKSSQVDKCIQFLEHTGFLISDLDNLVFCLFGKGMLYLTEKEINNLVDKILPALEKRYFKASTTWWNKIKEQYAAQYKDPYEELFINYPYWIEEAKVLKTKAGLIK